MGLVAQEVEPLFPVAIEQETVGDAEVQYLQLDYTKFVPLIISAIQQLAAKISHLAATVASFADHFTTKELTFTRATGDEIIVKKMCVQKTDGTPVCVDGDQLAALLASAGQPVAAPASSPSGGGSSDPTTPPTPVAITSPETSDVATSSPTATKSAPPVINSPPLVPEDTTEYPAPTPSSPAPAPPEPTPTTDTVH